MNLLNGKKQMNNSRKKAKKHFQALLLIFLMSILLATSVPTVSPAADSSAASAAPVIAMFGDSITKGVDGTGTTVSTNLIYWLKKYLGVKVTGFGVSSMGYLRKVPSSGLRAYDKISATDLSPYNTIILCFGVNDDKTSSLTLGAAGSTSEDTVVGQMRKCIKYIQKKKPSAAIIVVAPFMSEGNDRAVMRATFKKVASSLGVSFIDQTDSPYNLTTISGGASYDGVHPNAAYYKKIGGWLSAKVRKILGIKPNISSATLSMDSSYTYTGAAIRPSPTVTVNVDGVLTTLTRGTDYTIAYSNNINTGTASLTVKARGNYTGTHTESFTITKVQLGSATLAHAYMNYTGNARTQTADTVVKATVNGKSVTLKNGTDYKITYKNNINAGTATMTITGTGHYKGTINKTFTIRQVNLTTSGSVALKFPAKVYTGTPRTQSLSSVVTAVSNGKTLRLTLGKDYTTSYLNNVEPGTATMIIKGIGNYKGTITTTFKIVKQ